LAVFSALCVALHPGLVLKRNEGGMSNYGIHIKTAVPYALAFVGAGWYSFQAARLLSKVSGKGRIIRLILQLFSVMVLAIMLSTFVYKIDLTLDDLHVLVNIIAGIFETAAAVWLFFVFRGRKTLTLWLGIELIGFSLGLLTVASVVHLVFVSEVATAVGFGFLLMTCVTEMFGQQSEPLGVIER
jgi:hypothetical protein